MTTAFEVLQQILVTWWHTLPWLAGMGLAFSILSRWSPCNQGKSWWEKRGLVTDFLYWILSPLFTRYLRIWVTVFLTVWIFHISDGMKISEFYLHGHGPLSRLPYWVQVVGYLLATDFALYWIHRGFHRGLLWKYHAVHHATQQLEWISAARFHPVNLALGAALVDVVALFAGITPDIFLIVGPFNIITSCMVHANLSWTFGPLRTVFVSPVFHRWHHAKAVCDKNFASTFSLWDVMFGTYHMPVGELPKDYGIDDSEMPEGLVPQLLYPLVQREARARAPAQAGI
ncbi:MAG TPA: sterol desaturase family protein [Rhizomicrobium sp.]|jgi:sterol desaturase/sphingolipid hydroxylase (fatty acid hydroxylase superfamily)|nr:sterol desaturase family protein [Rhizomicrobium sp.]